MLPEITISSNFRRRAWFSALSIVLFALVFLILLAASIYLTWFFGTIGLSIMAADFSFGTLLVGLGLISLGTMILLFLLKFVFQNQKMDRSDFIEITEAEEPELFDMIKGVVEKVGTHFPKHVYLNADINAFVFYDSNFWSMFLPIRKNLCIGLGLLNSTTQSEFKAILAHEFGHFSQRSMKLGIYVYQVNHVIHNLLNNNEGYNKWISNLASLHIVFSLVVWLGIFIIRGIQWILNQMYKLVNLSYMGLSREMEFHADEVAAHVAGSKAMASGLLRINFASFAYGQVIKFYQNRIFEAKKTSDLFKQHGFALHFLAEQYNFPIKGHLPQIPANIGLRFNPFKLIIEDQWASHPEIEDRVTRVEALNLPGEEEEKLALDLLKKAQHFSEIFTAKAFEGVTYNRQPDEVDLAAFKENYAKDFEANAFPALFKAFFDYRNIANVAFEEIEKPASGQHKLSTYFSEDTQAKLSEFRGLTTDLNSLDLMMKGEIVVNTFEYDGRKYRKNEKEALSRLLKLRLDQVEKELAAHELDMLRQSFAIAKSRGEAALFREKYEAYAQFDRDFELEQAIGLQMRGAVQFMQVETPNEVIRASVQKVKELEPALKAKIADLRQRYSPFWVSNRLHAIFNDFNDANNQYFTQYGHYLEQEIHQLFEVIDAFFSLFTELYFKIKQDFLRYLAGLEG